MRIDSLLLTLLSVVTANVSAQKLTAPKIVLKIADDPCRADVLFNPVHQKEICTPHLDAPEKKPLNLLVITADDMNADSGGWNGNTLGVTPNLDAFAKSAHRFVNSHVTVPICQPGRSALMTGRVPHRNGALGFNPIRSDVPTLVELLRDKGYYTAVIAKAVRMAPAEKFPWHAIGEQTLGKQPTKFAEKFREMLVAAAKQQKPFFINANICDPHRPFISGVGKKAKAKADEPLDGARVFKPDEVTVPAFLEDISQVREEVAQYYSSVNRFDVAFGLVMKELTAAGRDADTVVVFMSDHGMSFPFSKATVYHNGTWSPVLIRIPGLSEAQTRTEFVSSVDVTRNCQPSKRRWKNTNRRRDDMTRHRKQSNDNPHQ